MKFQKIMALGMAAVLMTAAFTGCSSKPKVQEGKTALQIGDWPDDTWGEEYCAKFDAYEAEFEAQNDKYDIIKDQSVFTDPKIYAAKAAANQLPTMWQMHFTEIQNTIKLGYVRPITELMQKNGYIDAMNEKILDLIKGPDGEVYGFPTETSVMALTINKDLFEQAGLVNADGSVKIPDTYQELAEYAQIIKEKTGKAGFATGTMSNHGGWLLMSIAWSHGVKFMEQQEDGKWKATFNSQEMIDTLQYISDLKWKYDALPAESTVSRGDLLKKMAVGEAAMIIMNPLNDYTVDGMDPGSLVFAKLPKGPAGRYAQMGGEIKMFNKNATDEEVEACFEWLGILGHSLQADEESIEAMKKSAARTIETKGIILPNAAMPVWSNSDRWAAKLEAEKEYVNISEEQCKSYFDMSDVTVKPEEPVACQQLYSVLDGCIQEVITNKDADIAKLVETACNDFQVNHLDKQ